MLGKLLKYEFRATGRVMLPSLGVLTVLVLLANLSVCLLGQTGALLTVLLVLVLILAVIAVIAAEIIPLVLMIQRFHRNLLSNEGYLMHTLPVNVHSLVWSKLIVSLVWLLAANLVLFLLGSLSALFLSGTDLGQIFAGFPSLAEIREALAKVGIGLWEILLPMAEMLLLVVLSGLVVCLYFYASLSLGYMFTRRKGLMCVVMFVGISILLTILTNVLGYAGLRQLGESSIGEGAAAFLRVLRISLGCCTLYLLLESGLLYLGTVLGLKKGLNLG